MRKIAEAIVKLRIPLIVLFIIMTIFFGLQIPRLQKSYDYESMLPGDVPSIEGLDRMKEDIKFGSSETVILKGIDNVERVERFLDKAEKLPGYTSVLWVNDVADPLKPAEFQSTDTSGWVQGTTYKVQVNFSTKEEDNLPNAHKLKEYADQYGGPGSEVLSTAELNQEVKDYSLGKTTRYFLMGTLLVFLFLLVYFPDPLTPVFILLTMMGAVVANIGLSAAVGQKLFFITETVVAILQLATTYDYALFLYHRFIEEKQSSAPEEAMIVALTKTMKAIILSALTTIGGFYALTFGRLVIIKEMGWMLARGVLICFLFVILFLPAFLLTFDSKTRSRRFDLERWLARGAHGFGNVIARSAVWLVVLFLILSPLSYLGQKHLVKSFAREDYIPPHIGYVNVKKDYEAIFGDKDTIYLVFEKSADYVPALLRIEKLPGVKSVLHPSTLVDARIPEEMVPREIADKFYGTTYTMAMVSSIYSPADERDSQLKNTIWKEMNTVKGEKYVTGASAITDDLKAVGTSDLDKTQRIADIIVLVLLLIGFSSLSLPLLLVLVIQTAIWTNLAAYPMFSMAVSFIVPIVLNTIQLGSTVDYSVLTTTRFEEELQKGNRNAIQDTITGCMPSIFVSAMTFILMALPTAILSDIPALRQIMFALIRGAAISAVIVIVFTTALLTVLRKPIGWTSLGFKTRKETN